MTTPTGNTRLGPRLFAAIAFCVGVAIFALAYHELGDQEFSPQNERFAPLVVAGMWVVFSGVYLLRQFIAPHIDDPRATTGGTETQDTDSDAGVDSDQDDADGRDAGLADADADPSDVRWRTPALLTLALIAYVIALDGLGFLLSTAAFFFAAAWIFGSRRYLRDAAIGITISATIYFSFTQLLMLYLPPGVLPL